MTKRILSLIVIFALIACMCLNISAEGSPRLVIEGGMGNVGETINVTLTFHDLPEVSGIALMNFEYNTDAFILNTEAITYSLAEPITNYNPTNQGYAIISMTGPIDVNGSSITFPLTINPDYEWRYSWSEYPFTCTCEYTVGSEQQAVVVESGYLGVINTLQTCGSNLTYKVENDILTISGTGEMYDYYTAGTPSGAPWGDVTGVIIEEGVTSIGKWAFHNNDMEYCQLPSTLTHIGENAFYNTQNLKSITIPSGTVTIGKSAFSESGLETIYLSDTVSEIGDKAFYRCDDMTQIEVDGNNPYLKVIDGVLYDDDSVIKALPSVNGHIEIPENITRVPYEAFSETQIESVTIPSSMAIFEEYAFTWCPNLTDMYFLGDAPAYIDLPGNITGLPTDITLHYYEGASGWTAPTWVAPNGSTYFTVMIPIEEPDEPHVHTGTYIPKVAAMCNATGTDAYYRCSCGALFADEACTVEIFEVPVLPLDPANHTGETILSGVWEATENENGYTGDVNCLDCGALLEEGTVIPMLGHTHAGYLVPRVSAACNYTGTEAYYECSCGKMFSDEACVNEITEPVVIPVDPFTHIAGTYVVGQTPASYTSVGYTGDTYCSGCNTLLYIGTELPMLIPPVITPDPPVVTPDPPVVIPEPVEQIGLDNFKNTNEYQNGFIDINGDEWYAQNCISAYELDLMIGNSDGEFLPEHEITLAEVLTIACRMHETYNNTENDFTSEGTWYDEYIAYAVKNELIEEEQYTDYTAAATRYDIAMIFAAALPVEAYKEINNFEIENIPDLVSEMEYTDSVLLMYRAGIIVGCDETAVFNGDRHITRAEVAAIITRVAQPDLRLTVNG